MENESFHLFVRTRGGHMIHAHDCPSLKTATKAYPWAYATKQGWDYETILAEDVMFRLTFQLGLRFCRKCLSWHADHQRPAVSQETPS